MSKFNSFTMKALSKLAYVPQCGLCRKIATSKMYTKNQGYDNFFKNMPEEHNYKDESLDQRRARLHWQSRKRGIAETCLIFSTFSAKHLNNFTEEQVNAYDRLLNEPSNDWDIYYWMVQHKPTPQEYNNEIMDMLQEHCRNKKKEERFQPPELNYKPV